MINRGIELMGKLAACMVVIAATNAASNPLYGLKTQEVFGIVRAQLAQGHCLHTPAISEIERRLYNDEMTDSEESAFVEVARDIADCRLKAQASK
jgi:hypothetical protein